jgi:DnaJ-class molecular chaperone
MTTMTPSDTILFRVCECPSCEGEGEHFVVTGISREDGGPDGYRERCATCDGKGVAFIEISPIEMYDLPPPRGGPIGD